MIVKEPKFEISAVGPKQYPSTNFPEVVLVGKSNVGKSSFINTLINRKKLAKTSSEPGKTRQINFYNIDSKFYFVDLPGYGYSKMSKKEQVIVGNFIEEYLHRRKQIALIIFLVDIRHKPTENDKLMYNYIISSKIPFIIIANKAEVIVFNDDFSEGGSYEISASWRIWAYLFRAKREVASKTIEVDLQMKPSEFNAGIKEALEKGIVKKEVDEKLKITTYCVA